MTRSSGTVVFRFNPQKREPPRRNGLGCHKTERPGLTAPCMIVVCRICHASPARGVFQTADGFGCIAPQHRCPWRAGAYRRDSPSSQWEAVVEVSLSPRGIVARLPATAGSVVHVDRSGCAIVAPPRSPLRRAGDCTCNTAYSIVKVRKRRHWNSPHLSGDLSAGMYGPSEKFPDHFP